MNMPYKQLTLTELTASKVLSNSNRTRTHTSNENISQDAKDAETILQSLGLNGNLCSEKTIEAREKYMIETQHVNGATHTPKNTNIAMRQKEARRPHYTRLLVLDNSLVFQAACCLPLKIISASLDGNPVSGTVLFDSYSEKGGGKLVYEFLGEGIEMILDLKRGESTRAQRLIFRGLG